MGSNSAEMVLGKPRSDSLAPLAKSVVKLAEMLLLRPEVQDLLETVF